MGEWINGIGKITVPTPYVIGNVNLFLVKAERLTLVDSGIKTESALHTFKYLVKELGYEPTDIEQVILTHHHPDHVGLLNYMPHVEVYGHIYCEKWIDLNQLKINDIASFYINIYQTMGVPEQFKFMEQDFRIQMKYSCHDRKLNGSLSERMEVPGLPGWQVVEIFGHAQSHLGLFNEKTGMFFGGDTLLATMMTTPLLEPPFMKNDGRPKAQLQYNQSLVKLRELPIRIIFTGHGTEVTRVQSLIERRLSRQHDFAYQVKELLATKPMTAFEVCRKLFPKAYERNLWLTLSQTIGALDYLQSIMEVHSFTNENGVEFFVLL